MADEILSELSNIQDGEYITAEHIHKIADSIIELQENSGEGGGEGGTTDYSALTNKPKINGVTLVGSNNSGNNTLQSLGIQPTLVGEGTGQNIKQIGGNNLLGSGNITFKTIGGTTIFGTGDIPVAISSVIVNMIEGEEDASGSLVNGVLTLNIPIVTPDVTYDDLNNIPMIDEHYLMGGNQTAVSLGLQPLLIGTETAGQNIKTVGGVSLLGTGNIPVGSSPTPETITDSAPTIATFVGNKIYTCSSNITSLTITAFGDTSQESLLYFTTASTFSGVTFPSDAKFIIEAPTFNVGQSYVVSVQNNTVVVGEVTLANQQS